MATSTLQSAIRRLAFGEALTADEAADAFGAIMNGEATPAQVAALLMGLRVKGETPGEVAGAARALRAAMVRLPAEEAWDLVDTCGTGGGAVTTFNISTAAGLLAAGMGVRIAKHGNRSFTSQCGSADVLESLGVPLDASPAQMASVLREAGVVFMFAPTMHPAMRHVGPVRREIAVPTVMNIVGPLANPAGAGRQVIGVAERRRMELLAGALAALGAHHALVVHGEPGMDEISPLGETFVAEIRDGTIREWTLDPRAFGWKGLAPEQLAGGSPADNARIVTSILGGMGNEASLAAVALNAAAALYVSGRDASFETCVEQARQGLRDAVGLAALDRMREAYARARSS
jgi:anthranilate phosphoribosyltransferase